MAQLSQKLVNAKWFILSIWDYIIMGVFILALLFIGGFPFWNPNNRAVQYMLFKRYHRAEAVLWKALNKDTFSPLLRMNLAFNYLLDRQYKPAIREYHITARLSQQDNKQNWGGEEPLAFYIPFNSAIATSSQGDIPKALSFYQQALLEKPFSIETKTNIELLMKSQDKKQNKKQDSKNTRSQESKNPSQSAEQKNSSQKTESQKPPSQKQAGGESQQSQNRQEGAEKQSFQPSSDSQKKTSSSRQAWNTQQIEAVLRSIQQKEKNIQEQRDKGQNRHSSPSITGKDW